MICYLDKTLFFIFSWRNISLFLISILAITYAQFLQAELIINDIIEKIASNGIRVVSREDIEASLISSLNTGLKKIDQFAKIDKKSPNNNNFGIELFETDGQILVLPFQGGHAYKEGFTESGFLTSINNISVENFGFSTVLKIFYSIQENHSQITIRTLEENKLKKFSLQRLPSSPIPIELHTQGLIQYIRIKAFQANKTKVMLRAALSNIANSSSTNPIIIDLRYCSGGDLFEAIDSASLFLPSGTPVIITRDRNGKEITYRSLADAQIIDKAILLLVGPHTASSAEVFAQAFLYHQKGIVVGRKTWGKCSSQEVINLSEQYQLSYTNLYLLNPNGKPCSGDGIYPDIIIEEDKLHVTSYVIAIAVKAWGNRLKDI